MYSPKQTLVRTFTRYLQKSYQTVFGYEQPHYVELLLSTAHVTLESIANSDALYHDLEHTMLVTSVGQEILKAKRACEGSGSVTPEDWLNFVTALLCHDIGYVKGVCHQDNCQSGHYSTGIDGEYVALPMGSTDALLSTYHVDRGKQFVYEQLKHETLLDVTLVQQIIELTRFPVLQSGLLADARGLPSLGRAADLIGQFSDQHYLQKLPALFYEFEQIGTNRKLGYQHLKDVRSGVSTFYWNSVHPYINDAIAYLNQTPSGQQIVAELNANIATADEHSQCLTLADFSRRWYQQAKLA